MTHASPLALSRGPAPQVHFGSLGPCRTPHEQPNTSSMRISPASVTEVGPNHTLPANFQGELIQPVDARYDAARAVYNAIIDRRPALIARCAEVADVPRAIEFARTYDLPVAVRGTGHSLAGSGVCDGGLVIDLSRMKQIDVDPVRRTARAQPGLTWGEFDRQTAAFGLATTGSRVSTVGTAGVTLGGGFG